MKREYKDLSKKQQNIFNLLDSEILLKLNSLERKGIIEVLYYKYCKEVKK